MKKQTPLALLRPLTLAMFLFALLSFVFFDQTKHFPSLADILPFGDDPFDAVGSFSIQLTFVAACLSLIRAYRPYPANEDGAPVNLILRGVFVALFSISVMLASDVIAMIRFSSMWMDTPAQTLLVVSVFTMIVMTGVLIIWTSRAARNTSPIQKTKPKISGVIVCLASILILAYYPVAWRETIVGGVFTAALGMVILFVATSALTVILFPARETSTEDLLDDLLAVHQGLKKRFEFLNVLDRWPSAGWIQASLDWFNPRRHSGRLLAGSALFVSGGLILAETLAEGLAPNLSTVVLVISVYVGIESAAVGLGYLLFGKYLGLFRKAV